MTGGIDVQEATAIIERVLGAFEDLGYAELASRAPTLKRRRRFLGITLSETFAPVEGSYERSIETGPSGTAYNVTAEIFWSDHASRVIRVMVCIDDGGESAGRPLCESVEVMPLGANI